MKTQEGGLNWPNQRSIMKTDDTNISYYHDNKFSYCSNLFASSFYTPCKSLSLLASSIAFYS